MNSIILSKYSYFWFSYMTVSFIYLLSMTERERERGERERERERGERGRERNIYFLFHLAMHSLVDSCMCPDQRLNMQSWCTTKKL